MEKTFTNEFGTFSIETNHNKKIASKLDTDGYSQKKSIDLLLQYVHPESVVLDIGAHIGLFTVPLAKKAGKVFSFEPTPESALYLRKNVSQNNLGDKVVLYNVALGSHEQNIHMGGPSDHASFQVQSGGDISMKTLDSFNFEKVDLIKIDVEGYEPDVFNGGQTLIQHHQPVIFFELNLPALRNFNRYPLRKIKKALEGYDFFIDGKKIHSLALQAFLREPKFFLFNKGGIVFDVLAIPKAKAAHV